MLKKSFTPQSRPLAASAMAMFLAVPICASAGTFNITTAVTSSQTLSGTDTGTVTSTGSISVPSNTAIWIKAGSTGNVSNAGTISSAPNGSWATGISASGTWGGSLTNSGTIHAGTNGRLGNAVGVWVDTWNNANALNNSGTISASAVATTGGVGAYGVSGNTLNGTLTNSGAISASADAISWASANGVYFSNMTGNLTNSGNISAEATTQTGAAVAQGIYLGGMTGTLTNSADINTNASGNWDSATGIFVNGTLKGDLVNNTGAIIHAAASSTGIGVNIGKMQGNITNNGTISASGWGAAVKVRNSMAGNITNSGTLSSTKGDGIHVRGTGTTAGGARYALNGSITNSGTITAGSSGIDITGNLIGSITNSGTITAGSSGIRISGTVTGNITNSGTISGGSNGIRIYGGVTGNITNSGAITSSSSDSIFVGGTLAGHLNNSGTISAGSTGIRINGNVTGNITNSGTISTKWNDGIHMSGLLTGDLSNSGTITAGSNAITLVALDAGHTITNSGTITAGSDGIRVENNRGTITNSGSVTADGYVVYMNVINAGDTGTFVNSGALVNTSATTRAVVYVNSGAGNYIISNSGTITAPASGVAINANIAIGSGTLHQNAGTITGNVWMGKGDDTVNINGGSIVGTLGGGTQSVADTLNFNAASYTLQGEVTGFEEVNFNKGMTDLNGFSIFNGGSATIASGAGVVMNGGNGGNKIQGSLTNNGLLDVGYGGSTITGDYTQAAGSTTRFDLYHSASDVLGVSKDGNAADMLGVGGVATLGNVEAHVAGTDYIANGSTFWVMGSNNPFVTTNLKLSDNSAVLDFTADTSVTGKLGLTAHRVATYQSLAGSNYASLAGQLDTLGASGIYTAEQMAMLGALDASPTGTALTKQLADWSPDATGAELEGSRSVTTTVGNVIGQRIDSQLASAGHGTGMAAGDAFRDSGIWLQGFFGSATQDGTAGNNGYDASNSGFVIGGDTSVTANARVGLSVASTKNKIDLVNGATPDKLDIDSTHITAYGSYEAKSWNLAGMLASSSHDYDSTRNAINKASYSGSQLTMKVQGGLPMAMGGMKVTPVASFSHSTLDLDGYTETGAGGLTVRSSSYDSNEVGVGALLAKEIKGGNLTWVPRASLRYRHEMGDVKQETNATLTSAGISFSTNSVERSRGTVELGLGVDMLSGERFALQADYQLDSRGGYSANTGRLSVRYKF